MESEQFVPYPRVLDRERDAREGGAVRRGGRGRLASSFSREALARRSPVHLLQMI